MIKLTRLDKPETLTEDIMEELRTRFINEQKPVWKREDIYQTLLESSNEKCAYCGCVINIEDSYMEVEHFHPKSLYPSEVISWENLLPICKRCNSSKGNFDTKSNPFINPYDNDPKDHLCLEAYRLYPKNSSIHGENTIAKLKLNDHEKLGVSIYKFCNELLQKLEQLLIQLKESKDISIRHDELLVTILSNCQESSPFTAFAASQLHTSSIYKEIKEIFINKNKWTDELSSLDSNSRKFTLDSRSIQKY
jgi:hypothetical protein